MTDSAKLQAISSWLNDLSNLTAGHTPLTDAKSKIAALAMALGDEFPLAAFTRQSVVAVARDLKWFPSYGELYAVLLPWWQENQPVAAIPFDPHGLTDEDRALVHNFARHTSNDWGKTIPLRTDRALYRELDRYRHLRERVFQYLIDHNDAARSIAKRNGWSQPKRAAASPIQPEIRRSQPIADEEDFPDA